MFRPESVLGAPVDLLAESVVENTANVTNDPPEELPRTVATYRARVDIHGQVCLVWTLRGELRGTVALRQKREKTRFKVFSHQDQIRSGGVFHDVLIKQDMVAALRAAIDRGLTIFTGWRSFLKVLVFDVMNAWEPDVYRRLLPEDYHVFVSCEDYDNRWFIVPKVAFGLKLIGIALPETAEIVVAHPANWRDEPANEGISIQHVWDDPTKDCALYIRLTVYRLVENGDNFAARRLAKSLVHEMTSFRVRPFTRPFRYHGAANGNLHVYYVESNGATSACKWGGTIAELDELTKSTCTEWEYEDADAIHRKVSDAKTCSMESTRQSEFQGSKNGWCRRCQDLLEVTPEGFVVCSCWQWDITSARIELMEDPGRNTYSVEYTRRIVL